MTLISFPAVFIGGYVGYKVNKKIPTKLFYLIILAIGFLASIKLLIF